MTLGGIHHSHKSDEWSTPIDFYKKLDEEFHFTFDPCPINPTFDGLKIDWNGSVFCNPPYSQVKEWMKKAHDELNKGNCHTVVFLVFARTDTKWFHEYAYNKGELRFIKGRLYFGNHKKPAPSPSMLVILKK